MPALPPPGEGSRPEPDPTVLTTEQLLREIQGLRDYMDGQLEVRDERLNGIDRATELRLGGIVSIPKTIDEKVNHLADLVTERFASVMLQFKERDIRSEREARDNKVAVDAAFAAQKEAAAKQDESNLKAIDKSETATAETINKLSELFKSTTDALSDKNDDLKERVGRLESVRQGVTEQRAESRDSGSLMLSVVAAVIGIAGLAAAILIATTR